MVALGGPQTPGFGDETGANTAMTRTYGRAPIGERVEGAVPGHWESGVASPMAFPGAMDTPRFESSVEQILVPELPRATW